MKLTEFFSSLVRTPVFSRSKKRAELQTKPPGVPRKSLEQVVFIEDMSRFRSSALVAKHWEEFAQLVKEGLSYDPKFNTVGAQLRDSILDIAEIVRKSGQWDTHLQIPPETLRRLTGMSRCMNMAIKGLEVEKSTLLKQYAVKASLLLDPDTHQNFNMLLQKHEASLG